MQFPFPSYIAENLSMYATNLNNFQKTDWLFLFFNKLYTNALPSPFATVLSMYLKTSGQLTCISYLSLHKQITTEVCECMIAWMSGTKQ